MAPTVVAPMNRRTVQQLASKGPWHDFVEHELPQAGSSTNSDYSNLSRELLLHSSEGAAGQKWLPNEGKGHRREPKQPTPNAQTAAPARTPLTSRGRNPLTSEGKTRLNSKAGLFIPGQAPQGGGFVPGGGTQHGGVPPPPLPPDSKVPIRCVIEGAFSSCLGGLSMVDTASHTNVEVVVHADQSDVCATPPTTGGMAWEISPEARSRALYTLLHAFKTLGSHVKSIEPSADGSQLCVKYSEACTDRMCWDFFQYGYCPRPQTCRWDHITMDTFIITISIKPPGFAPSPMATPCQVAELPATAVPTGYVSASPMAPTFDQASGMMVFTVAVAMTPVLPSTGNEPRPRIGKLQNCKLQASDHLSGASPAAVELPQNPLALLQSCAGGKRDPEQTSAQSERASTAAGSERSGSPSPDSRKVASPCATPASCGTPREEKLARIRANRLCWADLEDDPDW